MAAEPMEFQFVNSTLDDPAVPQDRAVRVMIRRQAMKKASQARKRDANYGKHNLRQYPVFVDADPAAPEHSDAGVVEHVPVRTRDGEFEPWSSQQDATHGGPAMTYRAQVPAEAYDGRAGPHGRHADPEANPVIASQQPPPQVLPVTGHDSWSAQTEHGVVVATTRAARPDIRSGNQRDKTSTRTAQKTATNATRTPARRKRVPQAAAPPLITESQQWWLQNYLVNQGLASPISPTDYEAMSISFGFDLLELSTLATMHVGRATRHAISADPYHLVLQMRSQKQWSYLSYLPARYGHDACLKEAADCCVARAQQIVLPQPNGKAKVLARYVRALDSLQKALDDPRTRFTPDVLCATEMLAMYELLDPTGETAWVRHASGAGRLIQLRGPEKYTTEFEKALLMAHVGPLMTEALINNEATFLAQPVWQDVLRSVIDGPVLSVSDRSEIVISLHILKSNIPGYFRDVTSVLCASESSSVETIHKLRADLTALQGDLVGWRKRYEAILQAIPQIRMETMEYDRQCKVFSTYLSCQMITNRLLGAMVPYRQRRRLEAESQMLVKEMLHMETRAKKRKSSALLFMAQTAGVAGSVKASMSMWLAGGSGTPTSSGGSTPIALRRSSTNGGGGGGGGGASASSDSPPGSTDEGGPTFASSPSSMGSPGSYVPSDHAVNVQEGLLPAEKLRAWCGIMGRKCL